eukprot:scaffold4419_cov31-Tisochrysis_lutea.AAC.2
MKSAAAASQAILIVAQGLTPGGNENPHKTHWARPGASRSRKRAEHGWPRCPFGISLAQHRAGRRPRGVLVGPHI